MNLGLSIALFLVVCYVTSVVCAAIRDDSPRSIATGSFRLFVTLVIGMIGFCLVIEGVTWISSW